MYIKEMRNALFDELIKQFNVTDNYRSVNGSYNRLMVNIHDGYWMVHERGGNLHLSYAMQQMPDGKYAGGMGISFKKSLVKIYSNDTHVLIIRGVTTKEFPYYDFSIFDRKNNINSRDKVGYFDWNEKSKVIDFN